MYAVFDVLELDGQPTLQLPWRERRRLLEDLDLRGTAWNSSACGRSGPAQEQPTAGGCCEGRLPLA